MQIYVRTDTNIDASGTLTAHVEGEVAAALSRFRDHITRIEVHLSDESGGRANSAAIRCTIQARPAGQTPVTVTDDAGSVDAALMGAVHRLNHLLASHEGRQEDQHARVSIRGHALERGWT
jgi:ribosome-associated translation inhibitor RaiA